MDEDFVELKEISDDLPIQWNDISKDDMDLILFELNCKQAYFDHRPGHRVLRGCWGYIVHTMDIPLDKALATLFTEGPEQPYQATIGLGVLQWACTSKNTGKKFFYAFLHAGCGHDAMSAMYRLLSLTPEEFTSIFEAQRSCLPTNLQIADANIAAHKKYASLIAHWPNFD